MYALLVESLMLSSGDLKGFGPFVLNIIFQIKPLKKCKKRHSPAKTVNI